VGVFIPCTHVCTPAYTCVCVLCLCVSIHAYSHSVYTRVRTCVCSAHACTHVPVCLQEQKDKKIVFVFSSSVSHRCSSNTHFFKFVVFSFPLSYFCVQFLADTAGAALQRDIDIFICVYLACSYTQDMHIFAHTHDQWSHLQVSVELAAAAE